MFDLKMFMFGSHYYEFQACGSNVFVFHSGVSLRTVYEKVLVVTIASQ